MSEVFNRFGESPEHRKATIAAGGRWVQVIYTSGEGSPQRRDLLALAHETAEQAAAGLLEMAGYENERILAVAEQNVSLSREYRAALLA